MTLGIIGGTGLYDIEGIEHVEELGLATPFGEPSDKYVHARLDGRDVYFLPRHGRGHRLLPFEINHRANIFGFKQLGVERIVSVSAVGSLREDYRPRDIILPDQYFDRTKASERHTFFGGGVAAHIAFGNPVCDDVRDHLYGIARRVAESSPEHRGVRVHNGGTYVNMEGPAFSTKAESLFYRRADFDIIGMTSLAEAKLAREAEICYASMAMVTDYDCWHETAEAVTVEMIVGHLHANAELAVEIIKQFIPSLPARRTCACGDALKNAIITDPRLIPAERREALKPIIGKYLS
ncbi:MAG: S-methyl-5'-thioadenosine phosphorylase [Kiritimatiellae bacterium]|nr:S-methyl-5'-thioadenosine phosphorylase [Kiritimatiellia bacterium]